MVSQRNRIVDIIEFIKSQGIIVNIGKNYARGNKGVFRCKGNQLKIDISKNINDCELLSVIIHEYAHCIHYKYDKKLESLDFAFNDVNDEIQEELVNITVQTVPKNFAIELFNRKDIITAKIKNLSKYLKSVHSDFKISEPFKLLEQNLSLPLKFLLKFDKIKYFGRIYSIDKIENDFKTLSTEQIAYFRIKSEQRKLKRINSKISRLNKYYNSPTELFARFCELYFTDIEKAKKIAPNTVISFEKMLSANKITELNYIANIIK